jgi:hypothetical protein
LNILDRPSSMVPFWFSIDHNLVGELVAARWVRDVAEGKIINMAAKVAATE